ncbi:MAG: nucleotidyl transferase AbiEii/AbiGii toxin family protein [Candidatus Burarchaeum sp.]|nr:nucleotidyl transferase AbiEii/AbiGii toxin family protein [Candidatus Burarchaeum sp.]MDO8339619.1 nucleotidyl transferase AbiEii/AbiGii toxin family protein [Candidatus Burarchaeum sp.]
MLDRKEIEKYGPAGFHLAQKEKDYVQHWVLSFFSRTGLSAVFKGGTCLQKAYGLPRYSEDLDFTADGEIEPDFGAISSFLSSAGFSGLAWKRKESRVSVSAKLRFQGPLYNGKSVSEGAVLLEFSRREKVLLKPQPVLIMPPYQDILPYQLRVMAKEEIAAEKVRALLSRKSARDLFDLYFLVHQKTGLDRALVDEKLRYYGVTFEFAQLEKKVGRIEEIWKTEMSELTPALLPYETVAKAVLAEAKKQLAAPKRS